MLFTDEEPQYVGSFITNESVIDMCSQSKVTHYIWSQHVEFSDIAIETGGALFPLTEDGVFIGSDTMLVAPIKVGKNSTIGAGSTITKDVKENTLAISRAKQTTIANWKRKPK